MRVRDDSLLNTTLALLHPQHRRAAIEHLLGLNDAIATEGLAELCINAEAKTDDRVTALRALNGIDSDVVEWLLDIMFVSDQKRLRHTAVLALPIERIGERVDALSRILETDPSWRNRRDALRKLSFMNERPWPRMLIATDDPHWRVRHRLFELLQECGTHQRASIRQALAERQPLHPATHAGFVAFVEAKWFGTSSDNVVSVEEPTTHCPFWDWDANVLLWRMQTLRDEPDDSALSAFAFLTKHDDVRIANAAIDTLIEFGDVEHWQAAARWLNDPRLDRDARLDRLRLSIDAESAALLPEIEAAPTTLELTSQQRAEGLTIDAAKALIANPEAETSWHVLATACRLCKLPLWEIEPANPWQPPAPIPAEEKPTLSLSPTVNTVSVELGPRRVLVSRMGISGHYHLPAEGFAEAAEAGVNWFFWEPNYATLNDFSQRIATSQRQKLHFVAGTFEVESKKIRNDVERALRNLRVDRLLMFVVFWVQSERRLHDGLRREFEQLQAEGKVDMIGLSSHNRGLLRGAITEGWNPIMTRHSAAYRGAETELLPMAMGQGTSVITFNNLCYGRLVEGASPTELYRYSLAQPGVSACWSAPATIEQLRQNLQALQNPTMTFNEQDRLRQWGETLYGEEKPFRRLIREL